MTLPAHFCQDFSGLRKLELGERLAACPNLLQDIAAAGRRELQLKSFWLFGSRARGDASPLSDYDIAFDADNTAEDWLLFLARHRDKVATLLSIDWVFLPDADASLQAKILDEGIRLV